MKKIFTILFLLQHILFCQLTFEQEATDRQVITGKDLKAFGIGNLSDIFSLADKWFSTTIDRVNWQASANNLTTLQRQNYIVMLDGQRFGINIFDNQNINLLPISVSQIDSVEFINSPEIYNGEFTDRGLIHFHTKSPVKNLSASFSQLLGNETGDPGPFKFTEFGTPNIDKLNMNSALSAGYGSKNWFLTGSIKTEENYATSPAINNRISNLSYGDNKIKLNSSLIKLSANILGSAHQLIAGFSTQHDFFFFSPYGNEIPVERKVQHAGINGSFNLTRNISLDYTASFSTNQLNKWDNKADINFDFQLQNYLINLEGIYQTDYIRSVFGISYDNYDALTLIKLSDSNFLFKKVYLNNIFTLSKNYTQQAGIYLIKSQGKYAIKGVLSNSIRLDSRQTLKSNFTFAERNYYEDLNYLTWYEKGYSIPLTQNITTNIIGNPGKSRTYTADLYYIFKLDSSLSINLNGSYRQFTNLYVEDENYQYIPDTYSFNSAYDVYTGNKSKLIGGNFVLNYFITPQLKQKLYYCYQKDIGSNTVIAQLWVEFPKHRAGWFLNYQPYNDFGISTDVKYSSATNWTQYQYAVFQTDNLYNEKIKPRIIVNMSVQKWFLGKTIWTSLVFKNIFNEPEYYNPIGASSNLRFYFQIHVYLNSLPE